MRSRIADVITSFKLSPMNRAFLDIGLHPEYANSLASSAFVNQYENNHSSIFAILFADEWSNWMEIRGNVILLNNYVNVLSEMAKSSFA